MIKNIYSVPWIQGTLCFFRQAQVAQKTERWKNFEFCVFSIYLLEGDQCNLG